MILILAAGLVPIAIGAFVAMCVTRALPLALAYVVFWTVFWQAHHGAEALTASVCSFIVACVVLDVCAHLERTRPLVLALEGIAACAITVGISIAALHGIGVTGWVFVLGVAAAACVAAAKVFEFRGAPPLIAY